MATGQTGPARRICLQKHSPYYWRVSFDHPPLNVGKVRP